MFVDTSAIIAIVILEDDAETLTKRIARASSCSTSAVVILEATMRLTTILRTDPLTAEIAVRKVLAEADIVVVSIDDDTARAAVDAFARYGKRRGHKAQLNLADCLSYACAKAANVPLLYKGDDFARTDLA